MYELRVLAPGGGWATDTTGPLTVVRRRWHWLKASTRGRTVIRVFDRRTGLEVNI